MKLYCQRELSNEAFIEGAESETDADTEAEAVTGNLAFFFSKRLSSPLILEVDIRAGIVSQPLSE